MTRLLLLLVLLLFTVGTPSLEAQSCSQTVGTSANLSTIANSNLATALTICLQDGDYGTRTFSGITGRTAMITFQPVNGVSAVQMTPVITNSRFITIKSMTVQDVQITDCSRNVEIRSNTFVQNGYGIFVNYSNALGHGGCADIDHQIVIDGNTMIKTRVPWGEGKIMVAGINGLTISNNLIQNEPDFAICSSTPSECGGDAIQISFGDVKNMYVGPGNIFRDIQQNSSGSINGCNYTGNNQIDPHCDSLQWVDNCTPCTVDGNWFDNVTVVIQWTANDSHGFRFTNNLITGCFQWHWYGDVSGNVNDTVIEHNTIYNCGSGAMRWGSNGSVHESGVVGRSNILISSSNVTTCPGSNGCVYTHNTCNVSANCAFNTANGETGNPIFVGGTVGNITTYAGYALAANSPVGKNTAHDGLDRGIIVSSAPSPPAAPSNLRIVMARIWGRFVRI